MKATPEQRGRFRSMVADFAKKHSIDYRISERHDNPDIMNVTFSRPILYHDSCKYVDPQEYEVKCVVCWPEVRSLTDAATAIFVHVIRQLNLDGAEPATKTPTITNVIYNPPATVVFWSDGSKTVVKCGENDEFDPEKGLAMAISKKMLGNQGNYYNEFKKWTGKYEAATEEVESAYPSVLIPESIMTNVRNNMRNYLRSIVRGALG